MTEVVQQQWVAGFWRRICALVIDVLILGLVGFLLGLVFENTFVNMGGWGRLIGFLIALVYFGLMNSELFNGQTIGKKLLNLRVVNSDNQPIPLAKSVLRYMVLAIPCSLNGAQFSHEVLLSFLMYPLSLIIFGGLFSTIYLYLFNRVTRQSLHDLAVGTFVAHLDSEKQEPGKVWKIHLVLVAVLCIVAATVPAFTEKWVQTEPFKDMLAVQSALLNEPDLTYAAVTAGTTISNIVNEPTKTTTYIAVQAVLSSNNLSDVKRAREIATIVMNNYPEAVNNDVLSVTLTYGYDIGIWSHWSNYTHSFNPSEFAAAK